MHTHIRILAYMYTDTKTHTRTELYAVYIHILTKRLIETEK